MKILITLLCCILSITAWSQDMQKEQTVSDIKLIEQSIQTYFDGWLTADVEKIGSVMHETCFLKFTRDGKFAKRNKTEYLTGWTPRPRLANAEGRIISMDITNNIASAKCELEIPGRLFTDYFNMMNIDGKWYILDKISTNVKVNNEK